MNAVATFALEGFLYDVHTHTHTHTHRGAQKRTIAQIDGVSVSVTRGGGLKSPKFCGCHITICPHTSSQGVCAEITRLVNGVA